MILHNIEPATRAQIHVRIVFQQHSASAVRKEPLSLEDNVCNSAPKATISQMDTVNNVTLLVLNVAMVLFIPVRSVYQGSTSTMIVVCLFVLTVTSLSNLPTHANNVVRIVLNVLTISLVRSVVQGLSLTGSVLTHNQHAVPIVKCVILLSVRAVMTGFICRMDSV